MLQQVVVDSESAGVESLAGVQVRHGTGERTIVILTTQSFRLDGERRLCRRRLRKRIGWDRLDLDLAQARNDLKVARLQVDKPLERL
jgi:hypothetical protein